MLVSMPLWAAVAAHTALNTGFYLIAVSLPLFVNEVLSVDILMVRTKQ